MTALRNALSVLVAVGALTLLVASPAGAAGGAFNPYPGMSITAGTPVINTAASATTVAITDVQVGAPGSADRVPVQLSVDSGSLSLGSTAGLTFFPAGASTGGTISFAGTRDDVNAALATLTLTKGGSDAVALTAELWDPSKDFTCSTGHVYRVVDAPQNYDQAKIQAASAFEGNGYLVTLTSDAENTCVHDNIASKALSGSANLTWIGAVATYSSPNVTFAWDGGPESGTAFWTKIANALGTSGSAIGGAFARWDGEPIGPTQVYQPNAAISGGAPIEPCVVYYKATDDDTTWHDVLCTGSNQYVIEGDDAELPTAAVAINFGAGAASPDPSALARTGVDLVPLAVIAVSVALAGVILMTRRPKRG